MNQSVSSLIDDLRASIEAPYTDIKHDGLDCLELRMLLAEWIRLCQHPMAGKDIRTLVVEKIMAQTGDDDDQICFLFRLYTEACINQYLASKNVSTIHHRRMIHLIDSYTKLISAMVLGTQSSDEAKLKLLNNAFSVIILILSHQHQSKGVHFNQKPFLRLFVSLFNEISKINIKSINNSAMIIFRYIKCYKSKPLYDLLFSCIAMHFIHFNQATFLDLHFLGSNLSPLAPSYPNCLWAMTEMDGRCVKRWFKLCSSFWGLF